MSESEKKPKSHSWRPWGDHPIYIFLTLTIAVAALYIAYKQYNSVPDKTKDIVVVPTITPIATPVSTSTPAPTPTPPPPTNEFHENGLKFSDISCRKSNGIICQFKIQNETDQTIHLKLQGSLRSHASDQAGNNLHVNRVEMGKIGGDNNTEIDIPSHLEQPMTATVELGSQPGSTKVSELNLKFEILSSANKEFRIIFKNVEIN